MSRFKLKDLDFHNLICYFTKEEQLCQIVNDLMQSEVYMRSCENKRGILKAAPMTLK